MYYVTTKTGGTVVIGQHKFHAGQFTPFEKVPADVRKYEKSLVTISKDDPFAMKAEGVVVQPVTKNGVHAGDPDAEAKAKADAEAAEAEAKVKAKADAAEAEAKAKAEAEAVEAAKNESGGKGGNK